MCARVCVCVCVCVCVFVHVLLCLCVYVEKSLYFGAVIYFYNRKILCFFFSLL
jgi:hypothetical protein